MQEDNVPAYKKIGIPRLLNIKGFDLYYKDPPLKNSTMYIDAEKITASII